VVFNVRDNDRPQSGVFMRTKLELRPIGTEVDYRAALRGAEAFFDAPAGPAAP
jgi:hypothetical protein